MSGSGDGAKEEAVEPKSKQAMPRPQDAVYVHVFRAEMSESKPSKDDMSAVVITGNGEVYGTGRNTLIGWRGKSPMPMKEDGPDVLEEYVKVEALSGLGLRKIVVGLGFGAALTRDNQMYIWGGGETLIDSGAIVMVQQYKSGVPCHCGNVGGGVVSHQGGADLMQCRHTSSDFKFYFANPLPPPGVPVKVYAKHSSIVLDCLRCGKPCSAVLFNCGDDVNRCRYCRLYREVLSDEVRLPLATLPPVKKDGTILDVDCGFNFLFSLLNNSTLTLWGWKTGKRYETLIKVPGEAKLSSVSCGIKHLAAISEGGDLYCYGDQDGECLGQDSFTLRRVDVPAPVLKVCCGDETTSVCLLADHSVWVSLAGVARKFELASSVDHVSSFTDIANVSFSDHFFIKRTNLYILSVEGGLIWNKYVVFHISDSDCKAVLMESIKSLNWDENQSVLQCEEKPRTAVSLPPGLVDLYGKRFLSDLTFSLADGEFPAHRAVLLSASSYFKNLFLASDSLPATLDMTSYNPRAYKVLLQYFYQVQPDDLEPDDLFDLCSIASSYNETVIVMKTIDILKSLIRVDNVLPILAKGKSSNCKALIKECEKVMCSSAFKQKFVSALIKDPSKFRGPLED